MHDPDSMRGRRRPAGVVRIASLAVGAVLMVAQPRLFELDVVEPIDTGAVSMGRIFPALFPQALARTEGTDVADKRWTCPMHPHYIATEFGTCPICGMDLVQLAVGDEPASAAETDARAAVVIPPELIQTMGVRLAPVESSSFGRNVRSFGIVQPNERLQTEVSARVEGWVEALAVTAVGDTVQPGSRLFDLYSPQLIVSQNDYHLAKSSPRLREQSLMHLRAFGVQARALEQIERSAEPLRLVPFFADRAGTVTELNLRLGTYVQRGMLLARIQDYSTVWLMVSVPEKDMQLLSQSTSAVVSFPSLPGRSVSARVDHVYPTIDVRTRTGQVRLVIDNPDGLIRPGSYADVTFEVDARRRLAVPSEAVLATGAGSFIVVSTGRGRFEPRRIEPGMSAGRWTEVRGGVAAGEQVVVSGQFLLDSESALRESFRRLERLQLPLSLLDPSEQEMAMIDHLVDAALYLHEALVDGYDIDPKFLDPAISTRDLLWPRYQGTRLAHVLDDSVSALRQAQLSRSDSELRRALAALVEALQPWVLTGDPEHYRARKLALFRTLDGERLWLQLEGRSLNPYDDGEAQPIDWPATAAPGAATSNPPA